MGARPVLSAEDIKAAIPDWGFAFADLNGSHNGQDGWRKARCPFHDDKNPSLSFQPATGAWKCHAEDIGGDGLEYLMRLHDKTLPQVIEELSAQFNVQRPLANSRPLAVYPYHDEAGEMAYEIRRFAKKNGGKTFRAFRPDGEGGWVPGVKGLRFIPYRLPEFSAKPGSPVFVVEGEKDADILREHGLLATTNPFGAGKWRHEYSEWLRGHPVCILPDNDQKGRDHGQCVANSLSEIAASIRVVELPGLPHKGDISNWLDAGNTIEQLHHLVRATPEWTALTHTSSEPENASTGSAFPLPVLPGSDFLRYKPESPRWLVDGLIPAGACGFLAGHAKTYKSWIALYLALCVTTGRPFFGHATMRGKVWYLDAESILAFMQDRFKRVARGLEASEDEQNSLHMTPGRLVLSNEAAMRLFADELLRLRPVLVILDCFSRFHELDEDRANDMAPFLGQLKDAGTRAGCTLLVIHHSPKSEKSPDPLRGSGDLLAWYGFLIHAKLKSGSVTLIFKSRDYSEPRPIVVTPDIGEDIATFRTLGAAFPTNTDRVREALRGASDGIVRSRLADALNLSSASLRTALAPLLASGAAYESEDCRGGPGKKGKILRLAENPESESKSEITANPDG